MCSHVTTGRLWMMSLISLENCYTTLVLKLLISSVSWTLSRRSQSHNILYTSFDTEYYLMKLWSGLYSPTFLNMWEILLFLIMYHHHWYILYYIILYYIILISMITSNGAPSCFSLTPFYCPRFYPHTVPSPCTVPDY